ncbi:MAG: hypothetical protein Q8K66_06460 [Sediminibacterium sp.]|nr:hypothetical protein [Sediminibacterium sp.]MDP3128229.1 hypothetical protein [Sediminibacterium sp.]
MKKNLSIGSLLLSAVMMVVVLSACQKEQSTVTPETAAISSEQVNIVGVKLDGTVTASYAAALAANYAKVYHEDNQSQYVVFKANDLIAFVNGLKAKGATEVYVNFGVYGKGAAAVNAKDNGRLTVFFTGNKIPAPRGGPRTNAGDEEFLNHGGLVP